MNEKITKAKIQLILSNPFFATIALSMKFIEDSTIETACTDSVELRFNPEFIAKNSIEQVKGLIAHEVMHVASLHHTRRGNRDADKWNRACDYAINQILIDAGFVLPDNGLINPAYKNMTAEEIHKLLPDEPKDDKGKGNGNGNGKSKDPGGNGSVSDAPGKTQAEKNKAEAQTKQLISQAVTAAKQQGKLSAEIERLMNEALEPKVSWKDVLNSFITELTRNDYTFTHPSKRYLSQGLYLPSLRSIEKGKFVLCVDTSGSIDNELLNKFASEMQSILSDVAESITVIFCDSSVKMVQEFESDDELKLSPKGGGGTDFIPPFEYLEKNQTDCAAFIYFTDGYCNSFPSEPSYPVLWAVYDNKTFTPPFGEIVKID